MKEERDYCIRERALEIWIRPGCPHGRSLEHWVQAETELNIGHRLQTVGHREDLDQPFRDQAEGARGSGGSIHEK